MNEKPETNTSKDRTIISVSVRNEDLKRLHEIKDKLGKKKLSPFLVEAGLTADCVFMDTTTEEQLSYLTSFQIILVRYGGECTSFLFQSIDSFIKKNDKNKLVGIREDLTADMSTRIIIIDGHSKGFRDYLYFLGALVCVGFRVLKSTIEKSTFEPNNTKEL